MTINSLRSYIDCDEFKNFINVLNYKKNTDFCE